VAAGHNCSIAETTVSTIQTGTHFFIRLKTVRTSGFNADIMNEL